MARIKNNIQAINEAWNPMLQKLGVTDPNKLEWMSKMAHFNAMALNEADGAAGANFHGGAIQQNAGAMGGVYTPYNTLYNTLGIGDPRPAGKPALTAADYADGKTLGSGDKWPALLPMALKVAAKTIGFELVNTTPLQGPTGVLPYMDYVYSGSKQPYGATPAYEAANANPAQFQNNNKAYSLYSLPHSFKASFVGDTAANDKAAAKAAWTVGKDLTIGTMTCQFIGWSRIDGDPMFKILSGTKSLGEEFEAEVTADEYKIGAPRLISMLEDHIQGFTGAGPLDNDPWSGTYMDGTVMYEPMSRGTGELQYPRQLSLQVFTKNIQVGTQSVSVAVTQEQVTDLQKQWGIDVVKMIENAAINELSMSINKHILSRLFALGWKNHVKLNEVEGVNLNISFDPTVTATTPKSTKAYALPIEEDGKAWSNVAMNFKPLYMNANATFENQDTLLKRLFTNFLMSSNWILQRGRWGQATFAVTNITVATALQSNAQYSFSPIANNISQAGNSLYPVGTIAGITIYVDPLMAGNDTRILVGRKGGQNEPGVHLCPYLMAESVKMIAEGTAAPKVVVKSRYSLVDVGFYPETNYVTFVVDFGGMF